MGGTAPREELGAWLSLYLWEYQWGQTLPKSPIPLGVPIRTRVKGSGPTLRACALVQATSTPDPAPDIGKKSRPLPGQRTWAEGQPLPVMLRLPLPRQPLGLGDLGGGHLCNETVTKLGGPGCLVVACTEIISFPYTPSGHDPTGPKISLNHPRIAHVRKTVPFRTAGFQTVC